MSDLRTHRGAGITIYAWLALTIITLQLMPLSTLPPNWPAPNALLLLTLIYAVRRPKLAPPLLVGALWLLADLLFMRPPGLMAALVVAASQRLRARGLDLRRSAFVAEWAAAAGVIVAIAVANRIVLGVLFVPQPPLGPVLIEALLTILAYPPAGFAADWVLGLHRAAPGELDERGQKI